MNPPKRNQDPESTGLFSLGTKGVAFKFKAIRSCENQAVEAEYNTADSAYDLVAYNLVKTTVIAEKYRNI